MSNTLDFTYWIVLAKICFLLKYVGVLFFFPYFVFDFVRLVLVFCKTILNKDGICLTAAGLKR